MFDKLWEESPMVQKMREQFRAQYYQAGKVETLQSTVVSVVQTRFPDLTEFAQKQVKSFNKPDALETLFQKMLTAPDTTIARQLLESTPKK